MSAHRFPVYNSRLGNRCIRACGEIEPECFLEDYELLLDSDPDDAFELEFLG